MTKIPTNFIEDQLIGDFLKANAGRFYGGAVQEDLPDEHFRDGVFNMLHMGMLLNLWKMNLRSRIQTYCSSYFERTTLRLNLQEIPYTCIKRDADRDGLQGNRQDTGGKSGCEDLFRPASEHYSLHLQQVKIIKIFS